MEVFNSPRFSAEVSLSLCIVSYLFIYFFKRRDINYDLCFLFLRNVRIMRGNLKWYPL